MKESEGTKGYRQERILEECTVGRVLETQGRDPQSQMQKAAQITGRQHGGLHHFVLLGSTSTALLSNCLKRLPVLACRCFWLTTSVTEMIEMVPAPQLSSLRDIHEHPLIISKPGNSQKSELYMGKTSIFSRTGCVDAMSRIWDVHSN